MKRTGRRDDRRVRTVWSCKRHGGCQDERALSRRGRCVQDGEFTSYARRTTGAGSRLGSPAVASLGRFWTNSQQLENNLGGLRLLLPRWQSFSHVVGKPCMWPVESSLPVVIKGRGDQGIMIGKHFAPSATCTRHSLNNRQGRQRFPAN